MAHRRRSHGIVAAAAVAASLTSLAFWRLCALGFALQAPAGVGGCSWPRSAALRLRGGDHRTSRICRGAARSVERAEQDFEELKRMKQELEAMKASPHPRGGRRIGAEVWFDITLSLPLGLRLNESPKGNMVGVSQVLEGGSAFEHNKAFMLPEDEAVPKKMWVQPGDRLIMVNGVKCNTQEEAVSLITGAKDGQNVNLKFCRSTQGPITVVFPEPAKPVTVRAESTLSDTAISAGHEVEYECSDGLCGACWHVDDKSGEVYQLCAEEQRACDVPSKGGVRNLDLQLKGLVSAIKGEDTQELTTYDNTEPLVLRPCPEIHKLYMNPYVGTWRYIGGEYEISRQEDGSLQYTENGIRGTLREDGDFLVAELAPHGTIRVRPGPSQGFTQDMETNFRPTGEKEWGETKSALRV